MSQPDSWEITNDSRLLEYGSGLGNMVIGAFGLVLVALIIYLASDGSTESPDVARQVASRTVVDWRHDPIFGLAWSPDGRYLASSSFGPIVRVWDRQSGSIRSHEGGTEQPRFAVGWSADSRRLMVSGLDLPIESWDLRDPKSADGLGVTRPVSLAESTQELIRTSGGRPIRLWGPSDHRFESLRQVNPAANSIAFSNDGRFVASGGARGQLEIHDVREDRIWRQFEVDPRGITGVTFSPDSSKLATSGPGPLRIWEVESGRQIARLGEENGGSAALAFAPDGSMLAVAAWDGSILVWDLKTGQPRETLNGHHGQILALAWSPDGKTLASGGYDSTVRIWNLDPADMSLTSN